MDITKYIVQIFLGIFSFLHTNDKYAWMVSILRIRVMDSFVKISNIPNLIN